jgi:hypothetical protein
VLKTEKNIFCIKKFKNPLLTFKSPSLNQFSPLFTQEKTLQLNEEGVSNPSTALKSSILLSKTARKRIFQSNRMFETVKFIQYEEPCRTTSGRF